MLLVRSRGRALVYSEVKGQGAGTLHVTSEARG